MIEGRLNKGLLDKFGSILPALTKTGERLTIDYSVPAISRFSFRSIGTLPIFLINLIS